MTAPPPAPGAPGGDSAGPRTSAPKPRLFVVSGPSGVGKSTVLRRVVPRVPGLSFVVSHTTRKRRQGEEDGRDYHFVTEAEFGALVAAGAFVEWAFVHDHRYGTSRKSLESSGAGGDLLIEVDVQGARALREEIPGAVSIFIAPPEFTDLRDRLTGRGRESEAEVRRRLRTAESEMPQAGDYEHCIVNDDLETTVREIVSVIERAREAAAG